MKYKRLTKRDEKGNATALNYLETAGDFKILVDRLAELENKIENGTFRIAV